jgi:hypothetical protein
MSHPDNSYDRALQIVSDAITAATDLSGEDVEGRVDQRLSQIPGMKEQLAGIILTVRTALGKLWHSQNPAWVYKKIVWKIREEAGKAEEPIGDEAQELAIEEILQLTIRQLAGYVQKRLPVLVEK